MFIVPSVPTFKVWMGFASYWGGDAGDAKWRTKRTSPSTTTCSLTFAWRNSKSGFSTRLLTLLREPVMKLSSASTRTPCAIRASHRCEPMKPAPPETTARSLELVAADTPVGESDAPHGGRVVDVAPVDDGGELVGLTRALDLRHLPAGTLHGRRVICTRVGARREQNFRDVPARR